MGRSLFQLSGENDNGLNFFLSYSWLVVKAYAKYCFFMCWRNEPWNNLSAYSISVFSKLSLLKAISPDFFWCSWDAFWLHQLCFFVFPVMALLEFLFLLIYAVSHYALSKLNVGLWKILAGSFPHLLGFPVCSPASNSCWDCKTTCEKRSLRSLQPRCRRK